MRVALLTILSLLLAAGGIYYQYRLHTAAFNDEVCEGCQHIYIDPMHGTDSTGCGTWGQPCRSIGYYDKQKEDK